MDKIYLISVHSKRNVKVDLETNKLLMDLKEKTGLKREKILTEFLKNTIKKTNKNKQYIVKLDRSFKVGKVKANIIKIKLDLYNEIKKISELTCIPVSRIIKASVIYNYENVEII
ncbi:hypothetical protein [Streptobacillus moniliformis]|uniref:hypothetical protein n=1 Tax=Streptobacillus moniliformis TaxID=34105 RepID=UPI0007E3DB65|nr:hypothetical protein [Streptobacillus moniliformis]QXW65627.1 hypothetical protein KX935_07685 [Streptobacillus moniliformis]